MAKWPRYACHKVVQAIKVVKILKFYEVMLADGSVYFCNDDIINKVQVGWYLVAYEDGHISCSPPEAFESGYRLIEA